MGQVLHGSATTTEAVRRAIQHGQASPRALAKRCGIDPKTVAKWRARSSVADRRIGPKVVHATVLSVDEDAVVVAFRRLHRGRGRGGRQERPRTLGRRHFRTSRLDPDVGSLRIGERFRREFAGLGRTGHGEAGVGETRRNRVRQAERDQGQRAGPTAARERTTTLERENRERRQANEIWRKASAHLAMAELDRRSRT